MLRKEKKSNESIIKTAARYILFHAVSLPSYLAGTLSRMPSKLPDKPSNILVIDIAMLGDLLMTTPLLSGIKKCFPDSSTTVVCTPWAAEAIRYNPNVDHIETYEAFWEDKRSDGKPRIEHILSFVRLIKYLLAHKYEYAYVANMRQQPFVSLIAYLSGAKVRVGIKYPLGYRYLTHPLVDGGEHWAITKLKLLVTTCQNMSLNSELTLFISDESRRRAQEFIVREFGSKSAHYVCITPSTLQVAKRWKIASWIELINKLNNEGYGVVLAGGSADRKYIDRIYTQASNKQMCKMIAGNYNLNQFAAILKSSRCLISVDSAPVHVASALQVPCIVLYSRIYDFTRLVPLHSDYKALIKEVDCSLCLKGCSDPKCMEFTVGEIYAEFNDLMVRNDK